MRVVVVEEVMVAGDFGRLRRNKVVVVLEKYF